jgi:hypothetical protein
MTAMMMKAGKNGTRLQLCLNSLQALPKEWRFATDVDEWGGDVEKEERRWYIYFSL